MPHALEVLPLVPQTDGGDDWCDPTEWGHELVVQRWPDRISLCDLFSHTIDLSPIEARKLARILNKLAAHS